MCKSRLLDVVAMLAIGNGLLALLDTNHQMKLWRKGPEPWQRLMDFFIERPYLIRLIGAARLGGGLWLATRQRVEEN